MKHKRSIKIRGILMLFIFCVTSAVSFAAGTAIGTENVYAAEKTGTLTGTNVNVRTGPGTSYSRITRLNTGDQVTILDTVSTSDTYSWYKIGFYLDGTYTEGYITSQYVSVNDSDVDYDEDTDFESYLNEQGFPESYKAGLRELHAMYPKWVFVADHVNYDWNTVLEAENVTGRSLIYGTAASSWKSLADDAYNWETGEWYEYDSGGWVAASKSLIAYALDPRNFLNSTNIFMFESLSYNGSLQNKDGVSQIIGNSFMKSTGTVGDGSGLSYDGDSYTYPEALMKAGQISGVSPYHLATRIIQEIGSNGASDSISGTVSGYGGLYNYYNQGAYKTSTASAIINGLIYASKTDSATMRPWNTRMKSIIGGAIKLGSSYINKGQDTLYYEKFDLISPYTHQYMTNILAPRSESVTTAKAYDESTRTSTGLVFKIPVYKNMPSSVCELPQGNGSPNNLLKSLSVGDTTLTPTFDGFTTQYDVIVGNGVSSVAVSAEAVSGSASVSGTGSYSLNVGSNTITIRVTSESGDTRTYTINVVREDGGSTPEPDHSDEGSMSTNYRIDSTKNYISAVGVGSQATDVLGNVSCTGSYQASITDADGTQISGVVKTGDHLIIKNGSGNVVYDYTFVIYGDVDGDGAVTSMDLLYVKRHVLGVRKLSGAYEEAADANHNGSAESLDLLYIKRHILDIRYIIQK